MSGPRLASREEVAGFVRSSLAEGVAALYVDGDLQLIDSALLEGDPAAAVERPVARIILPGLALGAEGFFLVRYNPRGLRFAWRGEIGPTARLRSAGEDHDLHLIDHLLIGAGVQSIGGVKPPSNGFF